MLKHVIEYKDFNGATRRDTLYFNLSEFELLEIQAKSKRGIHVDLREAIDNEDAEGVLKFVKILVHGGYGEKSADGRYFEKSDEITRKFVNSALYSDLIMDLFTNQEKLVAFINDLMPEKLIARANEMQKVSETEDLPLQNPYEAGFSNDSEIIAPPPEFKAEITDQDYSEFEAWKAAKAAEEQGMTRPPHESGQGYQL